MKNINIYIADKYASNEYEKVENGCYKMNDKYFISIMFEQEPQLGEGEDPKHISQYPLEDILDYANAYVSDFYKDVNENSDKYSYVELCTNSIQGITLIKNLIGKHVYNSEEGEYSKLIIE